MAEWIVEEKGRIQQWTLNGAERRNVLNRACVAELEQRVKALPRLASTGGPLAVVITGAGDRAFCAGADLRERAAMSLPEVREFIGKLNSALRALETSDCVFVAAINGLALGGGLELALACDLRVAAPIAELAVPEVKLGIIPGAGGTQRLSRILGVGRAKDLVLTGRRVNAPEALALGLVNRLAPEGRLLDIATELCAQIADNAPIAVAAAKHAVDEGWGLGIEEGLAVERTQYENTLASADRLEGLRAFAEKRPPKYEGR